MGRTIITFVLFFLATGLFGQNEGLVSGSSLSFDWGKDLERITDVRLENDSLFVYKTIQPNSIITCAVYHGDEQCSRTLPRNVRDIYAIKNGQIILIKTESPKIVKVEKVVIELKEQW